LTARLAFLGLLLLALGVPAAGHSASSKGLIAFWSDRAGLPGVWVMKADGSSRKLLTGTRSRSKRGDFSPNGRMLVFDGQPPTGGIFDFDIQVIGVDGRDVMDADGGNVQLFFRSEEDDFPAAWNRRGVLLTRLSRTSPHGDVYVIRSGGRSVRRLTHCRSICYAADFSPSGDILFTQVTTVVHSERGQVFVMRSDGSNPRNLSRNHADETAESWAR
jgi:Tol biopolymer transport system component